MKKIIYSFEILRHKIVKLSTVLMLGIGLTGLHAQEVVTTSGGNASGTGGLVNYTVGQIVYTTNTGTTGSSAQGAQQPYVITVITGIEAAKDVSLEFLIYPNPATDFVKLKIENYEVQNLSYRLYDITGSLLQDNKVEGMETNISMQTLLPAMYFLKVVDKNKVIKTFKIIKK